MRILVADNHTSLRSALDMLLKCEPEFTLVGQSFDTTSLLTQARTLNPDLILLDWELPGQPTDTILPQLKALPSSPQVIALSGRPESEQAARQAGVDLFVSKTNSAETLLAALHTLVES